MGTNWSQVVKNEIKTNPGIVDYTKCQSAAFTYSIIMFLAGIFLR